MYDYQAPPRLHWGSWFPAEPKGHVRPALCQWGPVLPQNRFLSSQGVNQRCNICTSLVRLGPESPSKFPPLLPSLLLCLLPSLPFHLQGPCSNQPLPWLAKPRMLCTHLVWGHCISGRLTVDLCIPQNKAPTTLIHFSLANTHYPESLNFNARLCFVLFFKLSSRKGRNKAGEQNGIPCVFTLLSEERKNLREQPCLCLHCSLPSPQSPIFMVRKISPALWEDETGSRAS